MTIQLSENYPKLIRDLFLYDVGEEHYPKKELTSEEILQNISYMPLDLGKFEWNSILEEAIELPYKQSETDADRCYLYGPTDIKDPRCELLNSNYTKFEYKIDTRTCPAIENFIKAMNRIGQVTYISFKRMLPKHWINPHIDSNCNPFKVYVPLTWPEGNYFKIYKKGIIPFKPVVPFLVNTGNNIHSVVNDSNEVRYIFSFYADWSTLGWQTITKNSYGKLTVDL